MACNPQTARRLSLAQRRRQNDSQANPNGKYYEMSGMRSALQAILIIGGIAAVLIALGHIVFSPSFIPGAVPVNPTMDSEDRFLRDDFLRLWRGPALVRWLDRAPGPRLTLLDLGVLPRRVRASFRLWSLALPMHSFKP